MKKAFFILVSIIVCLLIGAGIWGYFFIKRETSDAAITKRLIDAMKDFGEVKVGRAHLDFLSGITIDNLSFSGTAEDVAGKSVVVPKMVIKLDLRSLVRGRLNVNHVVIVAPELTVEKPTDVWSLLDAIKTSYDKIKMPLYVDALQDGVEVRDLKVHLMEDAQTKSPEIKLSGINITFSPYAGSFRNISIKGSIDDSFLGSYFFTMCLHPGVPSLDINAGANNLKLDEEVLSRFPYIGKMLWDNYKPTGKVNMTCIAGFDNRNNQKKMDYNVHIGLGGVEALYEDWPFIIQNLTGDVELNPEKLYLNGLVGYIRSGSSTSQAEFRGEFDMVGSKKTFVMSIPNLFVNQEILKNVPGFGEKIWSKIRPVGLVDLAFQYNENHEHGKDCFLAVNCKDMDFKPADFPLPISHVNGQFRLCNDVLFFKNTSGFIQCGDQSVFSEMNGVYDMASERRTFSFNVPNLAITESLLKNLPDKALGEKLWSCLKPSGKADLVATYRGFKEEKDNDFLIEINLKDCAMSDGKSKFSLWGMDGRLEINKNQIISKHIDAKCYGGHIEGALTVNTGTEPYQYEGELNFSRISLEELVQNTTSLEKPWSGLLYGKLKYRGSGADVKNFSAEGQLNVNEGHLSDVPLVLSVFNFLSLTLPKKERFHSAQAKFTVKDGVIYIENGTIYSDTIELNGRGTVGLNGDIHINIVAGFNKDFFSQIPLVGKLFDFVVGGVRKQLTMVEIRGTFLKPESHAVPFKPLTKSIKNMFELLPGNDYDTQKKSDTENEKKR